MTVVSIPVTVIQRMGEVAGTISEISPKGATVEGADGVDASEKLWLRFCLVPDGLLVKLSAKLAGAAASDDAPEEEQPEPVPDDGHLRVEFLAPDARVRTLIKKLFRS